jgi:ion channel POLLUX/CASTOR
MNKASLVGRLQYSFDNYMARGTAALISGLAALSGAVVLLAALVVTLGRLAPPGAGEMGLDEAIWQSLMRTLDPGTMGGDEGWGFRFAMLWVTLGGIFIISALIGVLNNGIEGKLSELRKGRSQVVERDHTVILGWSEQVYSIVSELVLANANQRRACLVILGDKDKVEMEDEIRSKVGPTGRTRIVCRNGSPIDPNDLEIVSLNTARSIIILAPQGEDPDSSVIKTMLAITNNPLRRSQPYHMVAEIRDARNVEVARLVGRDEAELVLADDLVSRITAQTCRQSGLSVVYTELLGFGGDEIYFHCEPGLAGSTFAEALMAYEDSTVIGLYRPGAQARLSPPMDTRLEPEDQLIVIAEDDDTIRLSGQASPQLDAAAIRDKRVLPAVPERSLILGWNWRAPLIINELDHYVAPGSSVTLVSSFEGAEAEIARRCAGLRNQTAACLLGDTADRQTLDGLNVNSYDHVIVLSYSDELDTQRADARTLVTLLHLRSIAERRSRNLSIVSEMLDMRNRTLADVTRADDFIVSDKLVSLLLSQVSENKQLNAVFNDIFDPQGAEVYMKPAGHYVQLERPVNFYTIVEAARRRGEVAIGYRLWKHTPDASRAYGVVVNPNKAEQVCFEVDDRVIVFAEEG